MCMYTVVKHAQGYTCHHNKRILPVRSDTSAGGNHDKVGLGILLGHKHHLTSGSSQKDLVTGLGVAQEVGADTLLSWVFSLKLRVPISSTTNAEGGGGALVK